MRNDHYKFSNLTLFYMWEKENVIQHSKAMEHFYAPKDLRLNQLQMIHLQKNLPKS